MSAGRKLSRRKLAAFVAEEVQAGRGERAVQQMAAYLIETKQTHSVDLLVRDVETILAEGGTVIADITSAHPLGEAERDMIAQLLGAKEFLTREIVDPAVLGGVRIASAGKRLDATLKHRIDSLKEIDSRKGTS